jgi:hypothetical protein
MRSVEVPAVRLLLPPKADDVAVSFTVSPEGEAVVAWASAEDAMRFRARELRRGASFACAQLARPATLRVTIDGFGDRLTRELHEVDRAFPSVHALPDGQLLVVGARAALRDGVADHNALVFDAENRLSHSGCIGDGVKTVSTTAKGAIWVGYFDEGVFGNRGWGGRGAAPIGAAGLNRFSSDLALRWSHHPDEIIDCYSLTTTGEDCYVCPYTKWPILRVTRRDHVERWSNLVAGASALVSMGRQVALVGGYEDERDRVVVGTLERAQLRGTMTGRLRLSQQPWPTADAVIGRDGVLHAFASGRWHALELAAIADALG